MTEKKALTGYIKILPNYYVFDKPSNSAMNGCIVECVEMACLWAKLYHRTQYVRKPSGEVEFEFAPPIDASQDAQDRADGWLAALMQVYGVLPTLRRENA